MRKNNSNYLKSIMAMLVISIAAVFTVDTQTFKYIYSHHGLLALSCIAVVACVFVFAVWLRKHDLLADQKALVIIFVAFLIRTGYVCAVPYFVEQNDVGLYGCGWGHLEYVKYLYENHSLFEGDPRTVFQFYQPPLHYIIMAAWLKINTLIGFSIDRAVENLQVLSLFYSGCLMIYFDKTAVALKLKENGRLYALMVLAGVPYFIIQAGALNNDPPATLLTVMALYYTIRWYEKKKTGDIVRIAFCVGLGMMTKISVVLIAPAIAFVFIYVFIKNHNDRLTCIKQFTAFGLISFPTGLWFPARNYIKFGMSPTYIPRLDTALKQYIGQEYGPLDRLIGFSLGKVNHPTIQWCNNCKDFDYGIFSTIPKYLAFGEHKLSVAFWEGNTVVHIATVVFLLLIALLMILLTVFSIKWLATAKEDVAIKVFLLIAVLTVMLSYIRFCFDYSFVCTMNVRYILLPIFLIILMGASGVADCEKRTDSKQSVTPFAVILSVIIVISCFNWAFLALALIDFLN